MATGVNMALLTLASVFVSSLHYFFFTVYLCLCVCVCAYALKCAHGGQRAICGIQFSPSTSQVWGIELRAPDLAKHLYPLSYLTGP